jgi:hypothetical protein
LRFTRPLVSTFSVSGRAVDRLRADCSPDAVEIQFWPPEDEHSIARNM